jgi:hypothetical protein
MNPFPLLRRPAIGLSATRQSARADAPAPCLDANKGITMTRNLSLISRIRSPDKA